MAHVLGNTVHTSGPAPGVFADTYDALVDEGYEHILSIHLSGELSGTVESARVGAQLSKARVTVLDSRTVAGAYGHAALHAHDIADICDSPEELAKVVTGICAENRYLFLHSYSRCASPRGSCLARVGNGRADVPDQAYRHGCGWKTDLC